MSSLRAVSSKDKSAEPRVFMSRTLKCLNIGKTAEEQRTRDKGRMKDLGQQEEEEPLRRRGAGGSGGRTGVMQLGPAWWKESQKGSATGYYRKCCNPCYFCNCCNTKDPFNMGQPYLETSVIKSETANEESLQDN